MSVKSIVFKPKTLIIGFAIVVAVASAAFLAGPPPNKGQSTTPEALENAGGKPIEIEDEVHDRPFDALTWSPTASQDRNTLVVISHGFSGDRTSHSDLAKDLAGHGYTVIAPTHPDTAGLESDDPTLDPLILRPRHLSLAIDAAETAAGRSFGSVAVIGHSLGGYSAMRLGGAKPENGELLKAHCDLVDDQILCSEATQQRLAMPELTDDVADDRVTKIVLLAPAYGPLFAEDQLRYTPSTLVIKASNDEELQGQQVDLLISRLPAETSSASVPGGHFVFLNPCSAQQTDATPEICKEINGVDRGAVQKQLVETVDSFMVG